MLSLSNRNILIISPESWNYIYVSKHYYAIELAKRGNKVFFLNPPGGSKEISIVPINAPDTIFTIDYSVKLRGQRFLPPYFSRCYDRYLLKKIQKLAGCKFDIIWNFENSRFYDFRFVGKEVLKVYHQVDLNQDFHVSVAAKTADICFCTTDFIKEKLLPFNSQVFKVHHGFSGFFSNNALALLRGESQNEVSRDQIRAFYVGNLDIPYLDIDLLVLLVQNHPDVEFVFVGPYSKENSFYKRLSIFSNVKLRGQIPGQQIPEVLEEADILLLIYKANLYKEQLASPHKILEYLAAGKIILATYTDEYKDKRELLLMANQQSEIPVLFAELKKSLERINSIDMRRKRICFALEHSYKKQLEKIESYITSFSKTSN